ncbi:hypothetical protein [Paenibacillus sp. IHBB 3054]|uniref:hypothetical protein n=1 Tax=Paenibacillus sp. IHBB 3054 TaxID=3425689 RepID=UPI003F66319B
MIDLFFITFTPLVLTPAFLNGYYQQLLPCMGIAQKSKKELSLSSSRELALPDPKLPRPGGHLRSPLFRGLGNIKDAIAKLGDGKLKTHALRLPKNLDSLKGFMQSVARKMNISVKRLSPDPATAAGRWLFHDLEPYSSRSKGPDTPLTPERQRQKDALESGEYSGRGTKGTGDDAYGGYYNRKEFRSKIYNADYTPHGYKHLKAKTAEEAKIFSETGDKNAQYLPNANNKVIEKEAL